MDLVDFMTKIESVMDLDQDPDSDNDDNDEADVVCTPDITEGDSSHITSINSLPLVSGKKYESAYNVFMEWRAKKGVITFTENDLMQYFEELSLKYKSSSLWATYSMLKTTLNMHHNVVMDNFTKLRLFLKRKSIGQQTKKAKTFTPDEINRFIEEAPDVKYLATKVS